MSDPVARALMMVGRPEPYVLGGGDWRPAQPEAPFTLAKRGGAYVRGCDCWGLVAWAYRQPRRRVGYNKGRWATVSDYVNCDSAIEAAEHGAAGSLWCVVEAPRVGDLLVWPSVRGPGGHRVRIGHVGIVAGVPAEWAPGGFELLDVVQCQASKRPAIMRGTGASWRGRETFRGKTDAAWRTRILRLEGEP